MIDLRHEDADKLVDDFLSSYGRVVLWAMSKAGDEKVSRRKLQKFVVEEVDPKAEENLMTVYEQLVEQGRKKGRVEGRVEGQAALLLEQLAAKFGPLSAAVTARVKGATTAELASWAQRILTKSTLAETLGTRATGAPTDAARKPSSRAR